MENRTRVLTPEILLEEYRQLLKNKEIESLPLIISGSSMLPFLVHGRDTIWLSRLNRPPRRGDVLLYQRSSGAYVLHRVYAVEGEYCTMIGDGQLSLERGVHRSQIIAIMTSAVRKGKKQAPGSFWWEFFEKVWIRIVPLRTTLWKVYSAVKKILPRRA